MSTVATLAPPCGGLCCQTGGQGQMAVGSPVQWLLREAVRQPWWAKGRNQRPPPRCCHLPHESLPAAPGQRWPLLTPFSFLQSLGCFSPTCASSLGEQGPYKEAWPS